jgi:hypothetical protein
VGVLPGQQYPTVDRLTGADDHHPVDWPDYFAHPASMPVVQDFVGDQ